MRLPLAITLLWASAAQAQTVCLGDSVTRSTPFVQPGEGYCERLGGINAGIGGQTAWEGLQRFRSDVLSRRPDVVVIMFGLNDAARHEPLERYSTSLRRMVRLAGTAKVVLMTPNPYLNNRERNRELLPYVVRARRVARRSKVRLVDNYTNFAELGLIDWLEGYFADELHPNKEGHMIIFKGVPHD